MTDIKITLSQDDDIYAADPSTEASFMSSHGPLYYPLPTKPRQAEEGCWVYFIFRNKLVARARAVAFTRGTNIKSSLYTYRNVQQSPASTEVQCSKIELATKPIPTPGGFQGFRYVKAEEQQAFEDAFK